MAEGRMLKRKITRSKKFAALQSDRARLLWFYMLPFTDVDGRLDADPEDIRDEILRKQRKGFSIEMLTKYLEDLDRVGLIKLYYDDEKWYLQFNDFHEYQNINKDREAKSEIPEPPTIKRKCLTKAQYLAPWEQWEKDGRKCPICNRVAEFIAGRGWVVGGYIHFQIDHIIPVSRGGGNNIPNLRIICQECNGTKGNRITQEHSRVVKSNRLKLSKVKLSKEEECIFSHWNSFKGNGWKSHRELTYEIANAINEQLKHYSVEQLKIAIDNYAKVFFGQDYNWSYAWTLRQFLTRKQKPPNQHDLQLYRFLESGYQDDDYLKDSARKRRAADRTRYYEGIRDCEKEKLVEAYKRNKNNMNWLIDEVRPEIKALTNSEGV